MVLASAFNGGHAAKRPWEQAAMSDPFSPSVV
jgi:hypothetical protein